MVDSHETLVSIAKYIWQVNNPGMGPTAKAQETIEPAILAKKRAGKYPSEIALFNKFVNFLFRNRKMHGHCVYNKTKPFDNLHWGPMQLLLIT